MKLLLSLTLVMAAAKAEVTIDLAKAVFDEDLGQFCVMQKASFISKCHVHRVYRYRMSNIHTNITIFDIPSDFCSKFFSALRVELNILIFFA